MPNQVVVAFQSFGRQFTLSHILVERDMVDVPHGSVPPPDHNGVDAHVGVGHICYHTTTLVRGDTEPDRHGISHMKPNDIQRIGAKLFRYFDASCPTIIDVRGAC